MRVKVWPLRRRGHVTGAQHAAYPRQRKRDTWKLFLIKLWPFPIQRHCPQKSIEKVKIKPALRRLNTNKAAQKFQLQKIRSRFIWPSLPSA